MELHGEWSISYKGIFCFKCTMRQYIVAKNVLDVIFYNHIGHGEKKNNISREEMSSAENYEKRVLPVLYFNYYLYFHIMQFQTVYILSGIPAQL